jgi:hypothetical protein
MVAFPAGVRSNLAMTVFMKGWGWKEGAAKRCRTLNNRAKTHMSRSHFLILMLLAMPVGATAKKKDNGRPSCATIYSITQEDSLGNVQQGFTKPKNEKWADKDLVKKYPDVCYASSNPTVKTVFVITVTAATYHGARVVRNTETTPTSGTIRDTSTGETATYSGEQTSTSSTTVPYSVEYGKYTLTVETLGADGKQFMRRRFEQDGSAGASLSRGGHPVKALIEDAVKWIHAGGLDDPLQTVR